MYNKCKIVMLASNEQADKFKKTLNRICFDDQQRELTIISYPNPSRMTLHHLYVLSNDEIKEGDWCVLDGELLQVKSFNKSVIPESKHKYGNTLNTCYNIQIGHYECFPELLKGTKVIASTDTSLSLPEIPSSFIKSYIEAYNKEEQIKEVEVEYEDDIRCEYVYNEAGFPVGMPKNKKVGVKPKTDVFNNAIFFKSLKQTWTREEVKILFKRYNEFIAHNDPCKWEKWIENNL